MRDARFTKTPISPSLNEALCCPLSDKDRNIATVIANDTARQENEPKEMPYNQVTDEGLASRRSKHKVRTHAEVEAATHEKLAPGYGLSLRAPMAGQCENDQYPWGTDRFGKQRS
jgi:hypothetical protein